MDASSTEREWPEPLSDRAKELLSWMVAAYLLLGTEENLCVIQTHPGGGQYDCLTIVDEDGNAPVWMNRAGESAEVSGRHVPGFWESASTGDGPFGMAERIGRSLDHRRRGGQVPSLTALSVLNIANWLNYSRLDNRTVASAWIDSSGGDCGPNTALLAGFTVPPAWLEQEAPAEDSDPLAWVFGLVCDGVVQALVNTRNGATIDSQGEAWRGWPALEYRPDGSLGCVIAKEITAYGRGGEIVARVLTQPAEAGRVRGMYQEEYFDPVTVQSMFMVPDGYFRSIEPSRKESE